MHQVVQIVGALLILAAYALAQFGLLDQHSYRYLVPNLVGAAVLAVDAYFERQWGFLLLEGVWALVTAWSLSRRALNGRPDRPVSSDGRSGKARAP